MADRVAETAGVDGTGLLDEDPCRHLTDGDLGAERGRPGAARRRRHQNHRAGKQGVGLDDDAESPPLLLVPGAPG